MSFAWVCYGVRASPADFRDREESTRTATTVHARIAAIKKNTTVAIVASAQPPAPSTDRQRGRPRPLVGGSGT